MINNCKIISLLLALTMVLGGFVFLIPATLAVAPASAYCADPMVKDIDAQLSAQSPQLMPLESSVSTGTVLNSYYGIGDTANFLTSDYGNGWDVFEKRGEGEFCEIWVATDLSFPSGDPRNDRVGITDDDVAYMIDQFDQTIYPIESDYFGTPPLLNGSNSLLYWNYGFPDEYIFNTTDDGKAMIMVFNIQDESYFNPSYPSYIAGYFWSDIDYYYDRNIIHIDCYDWKNRTTGTSARPWVYESTIAHEWQHLLHDTLDYDEESWINEGCSMYAEMLCDYGSPWSHINQYLATPSNSLVEWEDQGGINSLADYGAVALFTIYLNDHFGGANFIADLAANPDNGETGVTSTLGDNGYWGWSFEKVFRYWKLANLIHSPQPGNGWYDYTSIDFSDAEAAEVLTMEYRYGEGMVTRSEYFGNIITERGYDTGIASIGSYGIDYIHVSDYRALDIRRSKLMFNGNDLATDSWNIVDESLDYPLPGDSDKCWYSGTSNMRDVSLVGSYDLAGMSAAYLNFSTNWDFEEYWDFGFVQVSTDGVSWVSLENPYTTYDYDTDQPRIYNSMPGLAGYGADVLSFDLSSYIGMDIQFRFRMTTDQYVSYNGWYIDDVFINNVLIDNAEDVLGLQVADQSLTNFAVTIYAPSQYSDRGWLLPAIISDLYLNKNTEEGYKMLSTLRYYREFYIIISCDKGPADYQFGITNRLLR